MSGRCPSLGKVGGEPYTREEANEFCRKYGLLGNDAIHLACPLHANCVVLLTWDNDFHAISHSQIRIEQPQIIGQYNMEVEK